MSPRQPALPPKHAFLLVCNDHRWLVRAADNWKRLKAGLPEHASAVSLADNFLPNLDVAVLSSVLQYARSLVEFYVPGRSPDARDIIVEDFDTRVSGTTQQTLIRYKPSIEVHLLHLTAWRDVDYRTSHRNDTQGKNLNYGEERQRLDWNTEVPNIAAALASACREAANNASAWQGPFTRLADAIRQLERDPRSWPPELTEKADVVRYLRQLGLA